MTTVSPETVRRLAFVRYLYTLAVGQSERPEPHAAAAVLTFHDAVEFMLQLASEQLNVGKQKPDFMDYFDLIGPKLPGGVAPQKEALRRLNKSRVALKHHGTLPSRLDVEAFRATATAFFEELCPAAFGIDFNAVSLVDLVAEEDARARLTGAQSKFNAGDAQGAAADCALAFDDVVKAYEENKRTWYGSSPFHVGGSFTFHSGFFLRDDLGSRNLERFVDNVAESITALQRIVRILSLGLDYRKYSRFVLLTPNVTHTMGGRSVSWGNRHEELTSEGLSFCIDFIIETSLHLQEFTYEVRNDRGPSVLRVKPT